MARSKEELIKLLASFKEWYQQDFSRQYIAEVLKETMEEERHSRFKKFLYRRIGHLPDADFLLFYDLFLGSEEMKTASVVEVPKVEPIIEEVKILKKPEPKKKP